MPQRLSAVLLPLYARDGETRLLFIKRSDRVAWHKGEIAFPGGRIEPSDKSPLQAALREADEELGINPRDVIPLGALAPVSTIVSNMRILPFVGLLPVLPALRPDAFEVAEVIDVPLGALFDPAARRVAERLVRGTIQNVPFYYVESHEIWGATGRIVRLLLEKLDRGGGASTDGSWTLQRVATAFVAPEPRG